MYDSSRPSRTLLRVSRLILLEAYHESGPEEQGEKDGRKINPDDAKLP